MIDTSKVDQSTFMNKAAVAASDLDDLPTLLGFFSDAVDYALHWNWCEEITNAYFVGGFKYIAVMFVEFKPNLEHFQRVIKEEPFNSAWVIVGDVPPLHISPPDAWSGKAALEVYLDYMEDWSQCVLHDVSVEGLAPVMQRKSFNVLAPSKDLAQILLNRVNLIRSKIDEILG